MGYCNCGNGEYWTAQVDGRGIVVCPDGCNYVTDGSEGGDNDSGGGGKYAGNNGFDFLIGTPFGLGVTDKIMDFFSFLKKWLEDNSGTLKLIILIVFVAIAYLFLKSFKK